MWTSNERRKRILHRLETLNLAAFGYMNERMKSEQEKESCDRFQRQIVAVTQEVQRAKEDLQTLRAVEAERLRPFAIDLRRYGLRHHLTYAEPFWGASSMAIEDGWN